MKTIHYVVCLIKQFEAWFNRKFEWFFTNGRKITQTSLYKK